MKNPFCKRATSHPQTMANFEIEEFKYLVIKTGYTSRLIEKCLKIKDGLKEIVEAGCEETDTEEHSCENCNDLILFIYDKLWGEGLHEVSTAKEEIEKIRSVVPDDGIIVFRC